MGAGGRREEQGCGGQGGWDVQSGFKAKGNKTFKSKNWIAISKQDPKQISSHTM